MHYKIVSIDLAKNVFQVCGLDQHHEIKLNKKVSRSKLMHTVRQLPADLYVMEACYSSSPWARAIEELGNQGKVKLIPPHQVKPFLMGNKNDHNDAIAIAITGMNKTVFSSLRNLGNTQTTTSRLLISGEGRFSFCHKGRGGFFMIMGIGR